MFHFFKKYQDQHFKRIPYDSSIEERWEKFHKEQQEKKKKEEEDKKKQEEEHKKAEEERKLHPEAAEKTEAEPAAAAPPKKIQPEKEEEEEEKTELKGTPVESKKVDEKFKRISTYNGDVLDRYSWGQGVWDVTVQLALPPGTKPKMVLFLRVFDL